MLDGYIPPAIILLITAFLIFMRWAYYVRRGKKVPVIIDAGLITIIVACAAVLELAMSRVPWCKCGYIKLWHGIVFSSENSQHVTDWYTFSHIIHGFAFYGILWCIMRKTSFRLRLAIATAVEAAWEVLENTAMVVNRYRAVTISLDYFGDSVINSVCDILFAIAGFLLASRLPLWLTIVLTIAMEIGVGYFIRDNLTLNIIMLLYPIRAIQVWQMGG